MAKGRITDKTGRGIEAFGLMQDGILTTTSIGFGIKKGGAASGFAFGLYCVVLLLSREQPR